MNELKIKTTTNAKRCDVCHQDDCYDAERDYCARCDKLALVLMESAEIETVEPELAENIENASPEELEIIRKNEARFQDVSIKIRKLGSMLGGMVLGALCGALVGAFIGLFFSIANSVSTCFFIGALFGAIYGWLMVITDSDAQS